MVDCPFPFGLGNPGSSPGLRTTASSSMLRTPRSTSGGYWSESNLAVQHKQTTDHLVDRVSM